MITIEIDCSNHQRATEVSAVVVIRVDTLDGQTRDEVVQALAAQGWVVQFNGDSMDTYCSKKCAE